MYSLPPLWAQGNDVPSVGLGLFAGATVILVPVYIMMLVAGEEEDVLVPQGQGALPAYSQTPMSPTAGLWGIGRAAAAAVMRACAAALLCACAACRLPRRRRWMTTPARSRAHPLWRPAMAPPAHRSGPPSTGRRSAAPSHLRPTQSLCSAGQNLGTECPLMYPSVVTSPSR